MSTTPNRFDLHEAVAVEKLLVNNEQQEIEVVNFNTYGVETSEVNGNRIPSISLTPEIISKLKVGDEVNISLSGKADDVYDNKTRPCSLNIVGKVTELKDKLLTWTASSNGTLWDLAIYDQK